MAADCVANSLGLSALRVAACRTLYWSTTGQDGTVDMSNLDGSGHRTVVRNLRQPTGLAVNVDGRGTSAGAL